MVKSLRRTCSRKGNYTRGLCALKGICTCNNKKVENCCIKKHGNRGHITKQYYDVKFNDASEGLMEMGGA